jgi:ABC-type methionine transport system permease subunit
MGDLAYWDSMVKQFQPETSNFVIFDPNLIRIDKKYAVPGAIGAGGMGAFAAQDEYRQ